MCTNQSKGFPKIKHPTSIHDIEQEKKKKKKKKEGPIGPACFNSLLKDKIIIKPLNLVKYATVSISVLLLNLFPLQLQYALPGEQENHIT
jgi:hypothetical protein